MPKVTQRERKAALGRLRLAFQQEEYTTLIEKFETTLLNEGSCSVVHNQKGETVVDFLKNSRGKPWRQGQDVIYIQPLNFELPDMLNTLSSITKAFFHPADIQIRTMVKLPKKITKYKDEATACIQYDARDILSFVEQLSFPKDTYSVIAICGEDLFLEFRDFIFSASSRSKGLALVSIRRFLQVTEKKQPLVTSQVVFDMGKVFLYEVGQLCGLSTCYYYNCLMNPAALKEDIQRKPYAFCPICLRKIEFNFHCQILERFIEIRKIFTETRGEFLQVAKWYDSLLKDIMTRKKEILYVGLPTQ